MLTRPAFRSCYAVEIVDGEHVLLLGEHANHLLTGAAYPRVAKLLDEGTTVPEMLDGAPSVLAAAELLYVLQRLEKLGLIRESVDALPRREAALWDALGVDPDAATRATAARRVTIQTFGELASARVAEALSSAGVNLAADGDLLLALTDDYLRPELAAVNEQRLLDGRPWMLARPAGSMLWIGPLLRPGTTACWECVASRMRAHRVAATYVQRLRNDSHPRLEASYALPSTELLAAGMIATEVAKWLAGAPGGELERSLLTIDLCTMATQRHAVVRRPQCRACGEGDAGASRPPLPIVLSSPAHQSLGGSLRSLSAEATLAKYRHHVSPLTGIASELSSVPQVDGSVAPICFSGINAATRNDTLDSLRGHFRTISGGKGKTEAEARAGALCEAIERHSGIYQGNEFRIRGRFDGLRGEAIHPNEVMLYSAAQYAQPLFEAHRSRRVPLPFDEHAEIDWSPLWSLTEEKVKYLPTALCYYDYPLEPQQRFCWGDSNGCAAGNTIEEAILQGFLELVERDSVAVWWFNRIPRPAVDLPSFGDPYFDALERYYRSLGREIRLLDLTSDLRIPVFAAITRRIDAPGEDITFGFGAHLDARLAAVRALTEANQALAAVLPESPGTGAQPMEDEGRAWWETATAETCPHLVPDGTPRRAEDYPPPAWNNLHDAVEMCIGAAASRGLETLVLDQTRPDIGLNVVRVVVPGLRHFWWRLGPGRLYDVPVAMGWLPRPLTEPELNAVPLFF